ncbi:hypothetical protein [Curtobacterium sp. MCSS17_008]|uniref:hypothetical protein n=1 Tax=Curtobacterium sp. MCSS17_008 TaxID=2175647 RepID=UPI0015E89CEF|nr:hypothetical protein [Curtobacterium sp. MCSS17_008]
MRDHHVLDQLRQDPTEWHRRGMHAPSEIDRIVTERLGRRTAEPSYADFFVAV